MSKEKWSYEDKVMLALMTSPVWFMIPFGYIIFGVGALFGWFPEGGWLTP